MESHLTLVLNGIARSMAPTGLRKALSFEAVELASQERVQQRLPLGPRAAHGDSIKESDEDGVSSGIQRRTVEQIVDYLVKILCRLLGPEQTTRPAPTVQQSQGLLVKFGLVGSHSTVPRQIQKSKGRVVKPGVRGSEQMTRPAPALQQWRKLLVSLGFLLGSQSTVPRQKGTLVKRGPFGPEHVI